MAKQEEKKRETKKRIGDATVKTISVKEFVKGVSNRASEDARRIYIEGTLAVKDFERYEVICTICDAIIEGSYFTHDEEGKRIDFKQDSCKKYLMYIQGLLSTYTNIVLDPKDALGDFNLLNKYGLIDVIISYIPESQVAMFDSVLNMKSGDIKVNYYEPHAFVKEQIVKYVPVIHKILDQFITLATDVVENVDLEKMKEIMKK